MDSKTLFREPTVRAAIACTVSFGLAGPAQARVRTAPEEAAGASEAGNPAQAELAAAAEAFEARDFHAAVAHFEAAYAINEDPACLFNIGRVHEEAGELEAALARYEEFMVKPGVTLDNRAMANDRIRVLREVLDTTRAAEEEPVPPPEAAPAPPPTDTGSQQPANTGRGLIIAGAVVTGLGGAGLIGGGVFQALSSSSSNRVDSAPTAERRDELEEAAVREATIGDALLISGAVLVAVGLPTLIVGLVRRKKARAVAFTPTVGGFTLRF
ncbi:MAG: hypothetical protein ACRBN8_15960 [Nannocystales bacterium]